MYAITSHKLYHYLKTMTESTNSSTRYAGLFRRLFAIFYDLFLLLAIYFIVSYAAIFINDGRAIEPTDTFYPLFVLLIFSLSYLYFAWFWTHGGQTLGMKTWRMQLQTEDNTDINWQTATIRFFCAILSWSVAGIGFLWTLFDSKNRSWHDLASKTLLIDLRPK